MVAVQSGGVVTTIGDFSNGVPSTLTNGIPVRDAGIPLRDYVGAGIDPLRVWREQPSVRKVVGFIARNHASIPWHAYKRVSDTDRQRRSDSAVETLLSEQPRRFVSGFKLWHDTVVDACLYDVWCVVLIAGKPQRVSPRLLNIEADFMGNIEKVGINYPGGVFDITPLPIALGSGWSPTGAQGVSPMLTLQAILDEQKNAVEWRRAQWKNSPKFNGYIKRPIEAKWKNDETRDRFVEEFRKWRDSSAGGAPVFDDGMEYEVLESIKPVDAKDIEGRQLTDSEVASSFHIAPELVGARQGTFSNIAAFRQMLYGPALGPRLEEFQQVVNAELVPALAEEKGIYAELDREAALNGSFLEQAQILSTSVGGPWMLRAEARSKMNLPYVDGTEELIVPMNVVEGGLASPNDTAPPALSPTKAAVLKFRPVRKAQTPETEREALAKAVARVYEQQAEAAAAARGVSADEFHETWDQVMADAIQGPTWRSARSGAKAVIDAHNPTSDGFSPDVMRAYVAKMAESAAVGINEGALAAFEDVDYDAETDEDAAEGKTSLGGALAVLAEAAALAWAGSIVADAFGFGGKDAAVASGLREKTWIVSSRNPRASHASMNGETVPVDQPFSNGLMWPGDGSGDVDEVAGCTCGLSYSF
jgi:phage portal protein BeeE